MKQFHVNQIWDNDGRLKGLTVDFWPGNNIGQSGQLFEDKTKDNMSWINSKSITIAGMSLPCSVEVHIKFSHIRGKYVMSVNFSPDVLRTTDKAEILQNFGLLNGNWPRESWDKLKQRLHDPEIFSKDEEKSFEEDFADNFEDSGRNFAFVSLGYAISVKIPIEKLERLDKGFSHRENNLDRVAELVASIVKAVREMIE